MKYVDYVPKCTLVLSCMNVLKLFPGYCKPRCQSFNSDTCYPLRLTKVASFPWASWIVVFPWQHVYGQSWSFKIGIAYGQLVKINFTPQCVLPLNQSESILKHSQQVRQPMQSLAYVYFLALYHWPLATCLLTCNWS